jgi:integrase
MRTRVRAIKRRSLRGALPVRREAVALEAPAAVAPERNPALVYLASLAPGSRRAQGAALETMARLLSGGALGAVAFPWGELRYAHAQALRTALAERYRPATANRHLAALRRVLREAWRLGLLTAEEYTRAIDLPRVRGVTLPAGRGLSSGELRALFGACRPDLSGLRDAALLAVLYGAGLRRAEAVALELADFEPGEGVLRVRHGKGAKERRVPLPPSALPALQRWIAARGEAPGALLLPVRGKRTERRALSPQAILLRLRTLAARAGVARFSPHDLRRTFVSDLLDSGADTVAVAALAGHASPVTTAQYDRRPERARAKAAAALYVPAEAAPVACLVASSPGASGPRTAGRRRNETPEGVTRK